MKDGLTLTMVFEAESANYGEGFGNITTLKKLTRGDGKTYSYISRQALRYSLMNELRWDNTPVANAGVVQFAPKATVKDYPEIDLFGYMKTEAKGKGAKTRSAVVRLSNAVSLEPYNSDMDFLTNMGMARRVEGLQNAIAQSEIHKAYYSYTITIDLDKVGIDKNDDIDIQNTEKAERIINLLDAVEYLYRDIKGRRENLNPIFVIGGLYDRRNPYFEGRIKMDGGHLDIGGLDDIMNSSDELRNNTVVGYTQGMFKDGQDIIDKLGATSIATAFSNIKAEVKEYYA